MCIHTSGVNSKGLSLSESGSSHILHFPGSFLFLHPQLHLADVLLVSNETVRASDVKIEFRISDPEWGPCVNSTGVQFCVSLGTQEINIGRMTQV